MTVVEKPISLEALKQMAAGGFGNMVKAVVDLDRKVMAMDDNLHSDLEAALLDDGSEQRNLWGINVYPDQPGDAFIEFDSMNNIRPAQGNRSREVDAEETRQRVVDVVQQLVRR